MTLDYSVKIFIKLKKFNSKTQLKVQINPSKRIFERRHKKNEYFEKDIYPVLLNEEIKMDNYIKIKGDLNQNEFMNNLAYEINFLYDSKIESS